MAYRSSVNKGTVIDTSQSRGTISTRKGDESDQGGTNPISSYSQSGLPAGRLAELTALDLTVDSDLGRHPPPSFAGLNMKTAATHGSPTFERFQDGRNKGSFSARRRQTSIANGTFLNGPRALDAQNNKRSVSHSVANQYQPARGAANFASQDPYAHDFSINDISRFSFASIDPIHTVPRQLEEEESTQFGSFHEPTFNFDDFHDNLAGSPTLNQFPLPGSGSPSKIPQVPQIPDLPAFVSFEQKRSQPAIPIPTRKTSGAALLSRMNSAASTSNRPNFSKVDPMAAGSTTTISSSFLKGRRQTNLPPNAFNNINNSAPPAKAPRKSIGPGTFVVPDLETTTGMRRKPSVGVRKQSVDNKAGAGSKTYSRGDAIQEIANPPGLKLKTTMAPNRESSKDLLTPSRTPDPHRPSTNAPTTPNRRSGTPGRTTTPGGTNRRMSGATGLGARTVSPTDARRMKRMSTMPPAPPVPQSRISQAPPTPLPEPAPLSRPRSTAASPANINPKGSTPSSSRTTPDPHRKSFSSGQSLSSSTSYSSAWNSATTIMARLSANLSSSRLPTPKPRQENGTSASGEEIPPVPAIPKSYESPGSEIEQPFFSACSSSLPQGDTPVESSPIITTLAESTSMLEISRPPSVSSHLSMNQSFPLEIKRQQVPRGASKKSSTNLQLPPLNLLPLSTPTMSKIKAFRGTQTDDAQSPSTPPGVRNLKTPSTPMTASKATFSKSQRNNDEGQNAFIRSTTSHYASRSGKGEGTSPNLPAFGFERNSRSPRSMSPYISSSLPKTSGEFPNYMRPNFNTELRRNETLARPNGPRAPSYSIPVKAENTTPSEKSRNNTPLLAVPNKQILTRVYTDSRFSSEDSSESDAAKYDNMPPPKLPASATWNNLSTKSSSPTQKPNFFRSRRKASQSSTNAGVKIERQDSYDSTLTTASGQGSLDSPKSSLMSFANKSALLLSSGTSMNNKAATSSRTNENSMDKDDILAEEEMKKLASKRRDLESAARKLDSLRARARPASRMSAASAQQSAGLNIYERGEVVDFPDVYFTGTKIAKKIVGDLSSASTNFGYDDDRGDYNIVEGDHLAYRYEVIDLLGKGSFGQVVRCIDHKTGILVAIKIIRNKKRFHQQALVEVDILQKLKEWDPQKLHNVVDFDQSFYFREHLCISTDLLDMNLYEFIKAHDFRGFSLKLIRRFTKQMLASLVLLHGKRVIHCDLKPENILLAHPMHADIKVIDFGSSCFENEKVYTYIQSRFYRSPEVILGMSYGTPIDMWSLGCILAELFTGYPIFPGENEQEQLACIMEVFGPPEKHLIEKCSRKKLFFDSMGKPRLTVSSKGRRRRPSSKDLRQVLKCEDEAFLDFVSRCLRWDPARRMTPQEASKHEFITGVKHAQANARRTLASAISTPLKRGNSVSTGVPRPLPQPPASTLKPSAVRQDSLTASPNKAAPGGRRQSSAVSSFHAAAQAKRASHAAMTASANQTMSRLTMGQRTMSARTDLATAAAAASLVRS